MTNSDLINHIRKHRGIISVAVPGYLKRGEPTTHFIPIRKATIIDHLSMWGGESNACFDIMANEKDQIILGR